MVSQKIVMSSETLYDTTTLGPRLTPTDRNMCKHVRQHGDFFPSAVYRLWSLLSIIVEVEIFPDMHIILEYISIKLGLTVQRKILISLLFTSVENIF